MKFSPASQARKTDYALPQDEGHTLHQWRGITPTHDNPLHPYPNSSVVPHAYRSPDQVPCAPLLSLAAGNATGSSATVSTFDFQRIHDAGNGDQALLHGSGTDPLGASSSVEHLADRNAPIQPLPGEPELPAGKPRTRNRHDDTDFGEFDHTGNDSPHRKWTSNAFPFYGERYFERLSDHHTWRTDHCTRREEEKRGFSTYLAQPRHQSSVWGTGVNHADECTDQLCLGPDGLLAATDVDFYYYTDFSTWGWISERSGELAWDQSAAPRRTPAAAVLA